MGEDTNFRVEHYDDASQGNKWLFDDTVNIRCLYTTTAAPTEPPTTTAAPTEPPTTTAAPTTGPTDTSCCQKIVFESTGSVAKDAVVSKFLGEYERDTERTDITYIMRDSETDSVITNGCGEGKLFGYGNSGDFGKCDYVLMKFPEGFTGSCIKEDTNFRVEHYDDASQGNKWLFDDTVNIRCL